ncbi:MULTISPECIES: FAD-dependent oxidoreductase [unclassified Pseudomonas]|uniref:flavin monoamine oxidase family protein n=1 Tax=unclassified Pseudomonas TaxID=196821 RepID=UPI000876FB9C|nr:MULTISPECIES: FAD-dependent oxidoreductase [unclassified Pseudomonas]MDB6442814.1 FAD-dependent oxidoreductase [Pseudomonas sp. 21TX0197]SCX67099.1 Monoamine oxidase [Pseudomonas sp. NFACC32-1]SFX55654.1 Monoamine oxidase [Pseudomonas sp. NFACC47-1]SFX67365.1 Monoamine oxidase [Pseudomonas sp. NFACC49-2]SFX82870.1 Monoamine oxidase [Pseudomonas sp. NFACC43]
MPNVRTVIVGAGLSGLYAAYLLERQGRQDYILLEARDVLGGRIASVRAPHDRASTHTSDRFDLGPTWFWPDFQIELHQLIVQLGLEYFEQFDTGDMMVERASSESPARTRGYASSPASIRLKGGMSALIDALSRSLDSKQTLTDQTVLSIRATPANVEIDSTDSAGNLTTWCAEQVLLAMPPRLVERNIKFEPALPTELARQWRDTATWMAPHAKYLAIYDRPFWREQGLSGAARSARGPLGEIHDASMPDGSAALFGFFGVPAYVRKAVPEDVLREHSRAQLVRLFGSQAAEPRADFIKDWAQDPLTATEADLGSAGHPTSTPQAAASSGIWKGRLTGIASEWSPQFPGYVAGAIEATSLAIRALSPLPD